MSNNPDIPIGSGLASDHSPGMTLIPGGQYEAPITALSEHLRWMRRAGRSNSTIKSRRMVMCWLHEWLGRDPVDITTAELENWCDSMELSQVRWKVAMVKPYYKWIQARGIRTDNPTVLIITPQERRRRPRPIDTSTLMDAIVHAPPRILPWLLLAAYSGLRAKEICYLRREDFVHADGHVYLELTHTKGDRERTGATPDWVWDILSTLLPARGRCFGGMHGQELTPKALSAAANRYLLSRGTRSTLHTLRHWTGTNALDSTDNLRLVQELLGHASPVSTALYTLIAPERLHETVESLPRPDFARQYPIALAS